MTAAVEVRNVVKRFGSVVALERVSLTVADCEFFTLLGPSGCGKTTLLRLIAGFEDVSEGEIFLFGDEIERLPPNRRPVNTVFQQYALFPQMTVAENIAFGLRRLKRDGGEIVRRVEDMLALVQLDALADRRPAQLSGGQQQRVALARALAPAPKLLLLDEPLSALDLKLRQAMRSELKQIQQETGITFIFVTHDQEEALTMSDRIAVMSAGRVRQIGDPREIYEAPVDRFVADFIGETNLLDVSIVGVESGRAICELPGGARVGASTAGQARVGDAGHFSVRPEHFTVTPPGEGQLDGEIVREIYLGTAVQVVVRLASGVEITARRPNDGGALPQVGAAAGLSIKPGAARLLVD